MNNSKIKNTQDQALQQLKELDEMLYCDVDLIESMSIDEAREELRAISSDTNHTAKNHPRRHHHGAPSKWYSNDYILAIGATGAGVARSLVSLLWARSLTGDDAIQVNNPDGARLPQPSQLAETSILSCVIPCDGIIVSREPQPIRSLPSQGMTQERIEVSA